LQTRFPRISGIGAYNDEIALGVLLAYYKFRFPLFGEASPFLAGLEKPDFQAAPPYNNEIA
jgi:hypothetical protein